MMTQIEQFIATQSAKWRGMTLFVVQSPLWLAAIKHLWRGRVFIGCVEILFAGGVLFVAQLTRQASEQNDKRPLALALLAVMVMAYFLLAWRLPVKMALGAGFSAGLGYFLLYWSAPRPQATVAQLINPFAIPADLPATLKNMLQQGQSAIIALETVTEKLQSFPDEQRIVEKLHKVSHKARQTIIQMDCDPEKIRVARAFLVVHLAELRNISEKYLADRAMPNHDQLQKQFYHLLCDSEKSFTAQHLQLTTHQQEQLDIQIQVLREQLQQGDAHDHSN